MHVSKWRNWSYRRTELMARFVTGNGSAVSDKTVADSGNGHCLENSVRMWPGNWRG